MRMDEENGTPAEASIQSGWNRRLANDVIKASSRHETVFIRRATSPWDRLEWRGGMFGQLQWQSAFCQKFLKAGIAPKRIESRFDRENHHRPIPFLISLL